MDPFGEAVQRQSIAYEVFNRQFTAENQPGGLVLKINGCTIGTEHRAFLLADVGPGKLHPLLIGSLGEQ
jgi:hypothetical protein